MQGGVLHVLSNRGRSQGSQNHSQTRSGGPRQTKIVSTAAESGRIRREIYQISKRRAKNYRSNEAE